MSSCEPRFLPRRITRIAGAIVAGVVLAGLGGCGDVGGFRPMYASNQNGQSVQDSLAAVQVATIPSRVGQRLRNELVFQNTQGGQPAPPAYRLEIGIKESLGSTLVKSTGEALSQVYNLEAAFTLVRISDKKVLVKGNSYARAEFERFQQIYSNVRAKEDAENRAARQIADDLKTRLAAVLSREHS